MARKQQATCPLTAGAVVDLYFMEHRARLIDVAAFLDRIDRAAGAATARRDHRVRGLLAAAGILTDGKPERVRRVLDLLSDPTASPIPAAGVKGATGVWPEFGRPRRPKAVAQRRRSRR